MPVFGKKTTRKNHQENRDFLYPEPLRLLGKNAKAQKKTRTFLPKEKQGNKKSKERKIREVGRKRALGHLRLFKLHARCMLSLDSTNVTSCSRPGCNSLESLMMTPLLSVVLPHLLCEIFIATSGQILSIFLDFSSTTWSVFTRV